MHDQLRLLEGERRSGTGRSGAGRSGAGRSGAGRSGDAAWALDAATRARGLAGLARARRALARARPPEHPTGLRRAC